MMKFLNIILYVFYKLYYGKSYLSNRRGLALFRLRLAGSLSMFNEGQIIACKIKVVGKNNSILFDNNTFIKRCSILIKGDNCTLDVRGGRQMVDSSFELLDSNTSISVKSNTGFNRNRIVVAGIGNRVDIGANCIFAEYAEVWASDTHSILDANTNTRINVDKPVKIGDKVWIGNRALIMKGVNIESESVIGAGSIVTKNIESNSLVAGIPATCIRTEIKWDINRL